MKHFGEICFGLGNSSARLRKDSLPIVARSATLRLPVKNHSIFLRAILVLGTTTNIALAVVVSANILTNICHCLEKRKDLAYGQIQYKLHTR